MECNLCLKQSSEVVSLFAEDVVRLIEDLTEMLLVRVDEKQESNCCNTCLIDLQKACDIKGRALKWYRNSIYGFPLDVDKISISDPLEGVVAPKSEPTDDNIADVQDGVFNVIEVSEIKDPPKLEPLPNISQKWSTKCIPNTKLKPPSISLKTNNKSPTKPNHNVKLKLPNTISRINVKPPTKLISNVKLKLPNTISKINVKPSTKPITNVKLKLPSTILKTVETPPTKENKPLRCDECEIDFFTRRQLRAHNMKHTLIKCSICSASIRADNFKRHFEMHGAGPEICEICGSIAKNKESLRGHMFHQHKHTADTYKCELCGSRFRYKYKYRLHIQKVHVGERNHQCEICGKKFFTIADIRKHRNMTHLKQRPYICSYCKKGFSSRYALKTHVRQHTQETPYRCDICSEGFRQKVSLKTHLKSKHNVVLSAVNNSQNPAGLNADSVAKAEDVVSDMNAKEECR